MYCHEFPTPNSDLQLEAVNAFSVLGFGIHTCLMHTGKGHPRRPWSEGRNLKYLGCRDARSQKCRPGKVKRKGRSTVRVSSYSTISSTVQEDSEEAIELHAWSSGCVHDYKINKPSSAAGAAKTKGKRNPQFSLEAGVKVKCHPHPHTVTSRCFPSPWNWWNSPRCASCVSLGVVLPNVTSKTMLWLVASTSPQSTRFLHAQPLPWIHLSWFDTPFQLSSPKLGTFVALACNYLIGFWSSHNCGRNGNYEAASFWVGCLTPLAHNSSGPQTKICHITFQLRAFNWKRMGFNPGLSVCQACVFHH